MQKKLFENSILLPKKTKIADWVHRQKESGVQHDQGRRGRPTVSLELVRKERDSERVQISQKGFG